MTFGESVSTCFRKYADFTGRASVSEFWWFVVFYFALIAAATVLWGFLKASDLGGLGAAVFAVIVVTFMVPIAAVNTRRLHDAGYSAFYANPLGVLQKGNPDPSTYGPPPGQMPSAHHAASTGPAAAALFVPCPGCGQPVNRQVDRCPYCRADLSRQVALTTPAVVREHRRQPGDRVLDPLA